MNDQNSGPSVSDDDLAHRVREVLDDCVRRRQTGEALSDDQVISEHPELMPELESGLKTLRHVAEARRRAADAETTPPAAQASDELADLPPGLRVPGYTLVRRLSQGGQAVVFQAVADSTGRTVAVKVMREGAMASARERARFNREVQVLAAIRHPNVVDVLDRGTTADGSFFLVMEYIPGTALDAYVDEHRRQRGGDADPSQVLRLFLKICDAVNAAHLRGVIHRDLKPSNIRVDPEGEPHVLDFGLARTALSSVTDETVPQPVTLTGQFLGSLPWASPEQAEGIGSRIDTRSDVYSLGVILYQMLTGQFPYEVVGTMRDVLDNILHAEPTPPSAVLRAQDAKRMEQGKRPRRRHGVEINDQLEAVVLKALSKSRDNRYQTAGDLARDIAQYLSGLPTGAAHGRAHRRRRRLAPIAAAAAAAAALVAVTLLVTFALDDRAGRPPLADTSRADVAGPAVPAPRSPAPADRSPIPVAAPQPQSDGPPPPLQSIDGLEPRISLDLGGGLEMDFVLIPPGTFVMGSSTHQDAKPAHQVTLTKPFYLGTTEVTHEQFERVMGLDPNPNHPRGRPAHGVTWFDVVEFTRMLKALHPTIEPRLPSEAEWEYACRAGSNEDYPGGDPYAMKDLEWYGPNSRPGESQPVGLKKPNAFGLHDMRGNIPEWCADWWGPYPQTPVTNPTGPAAGTHRIFRGGSAGSRPVDTLPYIRVYAAPDYSSFVGFRVALDARTTPR